MITKNLRLILMLLAFQIVSIASSAAAASTDGIYTLKYSAFGNSAAVTTSTEHRITGITGQAIAGQPYQSTYYALNIGFWQNNLLPVTAGDLNNDGLVDLEDLVDGMYGLTGQGSPAILDADVNGDGKIETAELIHIMRKQAQLTQ